MDVKMGKQHDTFPDEKPEMPLTEDNPEVNRQVDPGSPEIPGEGPDAVPEEFPVNNPPEEPVLDPGNSFFS